MPHHELAFTAHTSPLLIAHRGGAVEAIGQNQDLVENTIPAFEWALEAMGDGGQAFTAAIETDVCATDTGELVVWHGEGAAQRSLKKRPLSSAYVADLRDGGARVIPTLGEVLEEFPDTRFFIDPKHEPAVGPLGELLGRLSAKSLGRLSVAAFSTSRTRAVVAEMHKHASGERQVSIGMGIGDLAGLAIRATVTPNKLWTPNYQTVQTPANITTSRLVRAAHAGGARVYPWVINSRADMEKFAELGVDGQMTDLPSQLAQVYRAHLASQAA